MKTLAIVVPAYNEADAIAESISGFRALDGALREMGVEAQILVVDDGSSDDTAKLAADAGARVVRHRVNMGLGAAVRTGMAEARRMNVDLALKIDADRQHDPADIPRLIEPLIRDKADLVYGNRLDRLAYRMPFVRRMGNLVFTGLMRWLTGWPVRDSQPGVLAMNQSCLKALNIPGDYNYTQQILLNSYHRAMRFAHVDVAFRKRETGRSFISLKYPFKVLPQIIMVLVSVKPMRVFVPIALVFLLGAALLFGIELTLYFLNIPIGNTTKPVVHVNALLGLLFFGLQTLFFGILAELIVSLHSGSRE